MQFAGDGRAQEYRTLFAHKLATHVIAISRVVVDLDIDELTGDGFQHHEDWRPRLARIAKVGAEHHDGLVVRIQHKARDIEFMRRRVGDGHLAGEIRRRRNVAMEVVHHQGGADRAIRQRLFHRDISGVKAAHEADLHQTPAALHLGRDDIEAFR